MPHKIVLLADTGIDTAYAIALALADPDLDVLGLAATAGNVTADQATRNVHILVEHFDPPKWPKLGAAPEVEYEIAGTSLHGPGGLGGFTFQCAELHHPHLSDKLLVELAQAHPGEVTVVTMGPLTVLARAINLAPDLPRILRKIVIVGGTWREPGNVGPVSEFHFYCDPVSARQVLRSRATIQLLPLDVLKLSLFSPKELMELPKGDARPCQLLRKIVPYGVKAMAQLYGIEGFHLKDVLGLCAVSLHQAFKYKPMAVDVETSGELTRSMTVFDHRSHLAPEPNVDVAVDVDMKQVRDYMAEVFQRLCPSGG